MPFEEVPKWGIIGWIQCIVQIIIILFGLIISYTSTALIGIGLSFMAIGFSLAVTQINAYKSTKQYQLLEEIKEQLNRIEKK